jgi:hypothetical protein
MAGGETHQQQLERLAMRVCAGEVVFFIGAGFSLDSEGNSAQLLIARLLARFEALTECRRKPVTEAEKLACDLRIGLRTTFSIGTRNAPEVTLFEAADLASILKTLAGNYYQINDWITSAFEVLIDRRCKKGASANKSFAKAVNRKENEYLRRYSDKATLEEIDFAWLKEIHEYVRSNPGPRPERVVAGKALFLDTLGFLSKDVMAGCPMDPELERVISSTAERLRLRHHVLAWLAGEGLTRSIVTTNYDLLLDCAYRVSGLLPMKPPKERWPPHEKDPIYRALQLKIPVNRRYCSFTRVADANQFFAQGDAHETALIHKIHGDVETYRIARESKDVRLFRATLPGIVFTFREIQNWREDSWSRDYLSTLMRTHTIVFAGYSAADPVVHDTFRTVYEEIAGYRTRVHEKDATDKSAKAFFANVATTSSFHGMEILRAASRAAGVQAPMLTEHPNLLKFQVRDQETNKVLFPDLDDIFVWLYHLTARELQAQALDREIERLAYHLFGKPAPQREAAAIIAAFEKLRNAEKKEANDFELGADPAECEKVRVKFRRLTDWTRLFHQALLREYRMAENFLRHPNDAFLVYAAMRYRCYSPINDNPTWAAWGVVIELALRRLLAGCDDADAWTGWTNKLDVIEDQWPAISFVPASSSDTPPRPRVRRRLSIELSAMRRLFARTSARRLFAAEAPVVWELRAETVPWWSEDDPRRPATTPSPRNLWSWAACGVSEAASAGREQWLGVFRDEQRRLA